MNITAIDTAICNAYRTNWVFVRVHTDAGIYGVGEATLEYREQTVVAAIKDLERTLIGRSASDIEAICHDAYRDVYWRGGPVLMSALSGVEMALWDIKGKHLGVPVYELLGGKVRDKIRCYANGWFAPAKSPKEFADKAKAAADAGWTALKWDPFGSAYMNLSRQNLRSAIDCIHAVRQAVGDRVDLLIEGHGRFNVPAAIQISHALEDFGVLWFEEPIPPDHLDALAEVRSRSKVAIAAGERLYTPRDFMRLAQLHAADYVQPDISHAGGISGLRKIATIAESEYQAFCPHNPSGPIANAATLQIAACTPGFFLLETMSSDVSYRREICTENVSLIGGEMTIPTAPGLGIDLNWEKLSEHPYEPHTLRHYTGALTDIRPASAQSYFHSEEKSC